MRRRRLRHLIPEAEQRFLRKTATSSAAIFCPRRNSRPGRRSRTLAAPAREMQEGGAITRRIPLTPEMLAPVSAIRAFLENAKWNAPIRYVGGFNVEPVLSIQTIFGSPSRQRGEKDPQTELHMDTFHSTAKAWYFLYDVPEDEGPFTYVAGSHRLTKRRLAWHKRMSILGSRGMVAARSGFRLSMLKRLHLPSRRNSPCPRTRSSSATPSASTRAVISARSSSGSSSTHRSARTRSCLSSISTPRICPMSASARRSSLVSRGLAVRLGLRRHLVHVGEVHRASGMPCRRTTCVGWPRPTLPLPTPRSLRQSRHLDFSGKPLNI